MTFPTPPGRARSIPPCPFPNIEQRERPVKRRGSPLYRTLEARRIDADNREYERRQRLKREARRRLKLNTLLNRLGREISTVPGELSHLHHPDRPNRLVALCCEVMDCTLSDLTGASRKRPIIRKRHVAMAIIEAETSLSRPQIARKFHRDPSTVLHARQKIQADPQLMRRAELVRAAVLQREAETWGRAIGPSS